MPDSVLEASQAEEVIAPKHDHKRRLLASFMSALVPGSGQLFLHQKAKAALFFLALCVTLSLYWPLRLPRYYSGLLLLVLAGWVIPCVAAWDAASGCIRPGCKPSRWWLVAVAPIALLSSVILDNRALIGSGFHLYSIPSSSMERTLLVGDRIIADHWYYRDRKPSAGDIVIVKREKIFQVKRIVATGGETIEGRGGLVLVDGKEVDEPYVQHIGSAPPELSTFGPIPIPQGKLFVMGDNRDVSYDSRSPGFGLVDLSMLVGKPLYVFDTERAGRRLK